MTKHEFKEILKLVCGVDRKLDVEKARSLPDKIKTQIVWFLVKQDVPIPVAFIPEKINIKRLNKNRYCCIFNNGRYDLRSTHEQTIRPKI